MLSDSLRLTCCSRNGRFQHASTPLSCCVMRLGQRGFRPSIFYLPPHDYSQVVGCIVEHEGRILLCRRAIEPCRNKWTLPAGFMEMGESAAEGAARETFEEANARVHSLMPFSHLDIPVIGQAYILFRWSHHTFRQSFSLLAPAERSATQASRWACKLTSSLTVRQNKATQACKLRRSACCPLHVAAEATSGL